MPDEVNPLLRLVPDAQALPPSEKMDPRLAVRVAVRDALRAVQTGADPRRTLDPFVAQQPSLVDAILEDERMRTPDAVAALRQHLGLAPDPWSELVQRITELDRAVVDPAERIRLAATLLIGDAEGLPAAVMALCHSTTSATLIAALHAVARPGQQRDLLEHHLLRMRREGHDVNPGFVLNRRDSAFHQGFSEEDVLVMTFREYPGYFTVFALQLGRGIEDIVVRPVVGEVALEQTLMARNPEQRESIGVDDCRSLLAASIARLEDGAPCQAWLALGHLVDERLFGAGADGAGFVVGESSARVLVDRFARLVHDGEDEILDDMIHAHSRADVLLELFGVRFLRHVLGLTSGVARLDVTVEEVGSQHGNAMVVGRDASGGVLSNTRLRLLVTDEGWAVSDVEVVGVGAELKLFGPIWERLGGPNPLPYRDYDRLSEMEQELTAGLQHDRYRIDEIASAVLLGRDAELEGLPGEVAAAVHAAFDYACGRPASIPDLAERYEADAVQVATLLEEATGKLDLTPEDSRYTIVD